MKPDEPYCEFVELGANRMMVFATKHFDGSDAWSIGTTSGAHVGVQIGSNDVHSLTDLKQLKKAVDGAVKYLDAQNKKDVAKGKNNDEAAK